MIRSNRFTAILAAAITAPALAAGETIIVNTTSDVVDFSFSQDVSSLPGPDGVVSLREAVLAANNTAGPQTIAFNIPVSDPDFNGSYFLIRTGSSLILTDDGTTIDGFTQTAFSGDTNATGSEIALWGLIPSALSSPGIRINSDDNLVMGMGGFNWFRYGIEINGNGNTIAGVQTVQSSSAAVHILGDANVLDGSMSPIRNRFSSSGIGVWVRAGGDGNQILGNLIQGNHGDGVNLEGNGNVVGGASVSHRNIINTNGHTSGEFNPVGSQVSLSGDNNVVQGNYLGVDETGLLDQSGSAKTGVAIGGSGNVVGGAQPGEGNVIAGMSASNVSTRYGIWIVGGVGNTVQGNLIGVGADGVTPIPNERNVAVDVFLFANLPTDTLIGGTAPGAGNVIANSLGFGVGVLGFGDSSPTGTDIRGNSIHSNVGLGIDIDGDGVTPNDALDLDTGPNRRQNWPVLASATVSGSEIEITGSLHSNPSESFAIEFFASDACDPTGHGEGGHFLGQTTAMTNASGDAVFTATLPAGPSGASSIASTATRQSTSDTSEFSACIDANIDDTVPGDFNGDGIVGFADLNLMLASWGPCPEPPTMCRADLDGDGNVGFSDLTVLLRNWG